MKKLVFMLLTTLLALLVLVSCEESKKVEYTPQTEGSNVADEKIDINDLVTIKEVVNKEGVSPNGEKVKYIYQVPVININKPGAQKVNDMFLNLEEEQEKHIGDGQSMTLLIESRAFLNDGIISLVMKIGKPGSGGIYVVNYDMENDKEISTKELLERYKFDPQNLIAEINRQENISLDYFTFTVVTNIYDYSSSEEMLKEIQNKTIEEKEKYVIENIDKIETYINNDGKFVFIHRAELEDEELVIE